MTNTGLLPALILSVALTSGGALAQTVEDNPNRAIEQRIEANTGSGAPEAERNTLGEAAATARTAEPVGSGAAIEWVGKPVASIDGTRVGTVSEVRMDPNGAVTEVYARIGGLLGLFSREVAIPIARIILEQNGTLVAEMSADEIKKAPPPARS